MALQLYTPLLTLGTYPDIATLLLKTPLPSATGLDTDTLEELVICAPPGPVHVVLTDSPLLALGDRVTVQRRVTTLSLKKRPVSTDISTLGGGTGGKIEVHKIK